MPATPKQGELRTFTVHVRVSYNVSYTVRARTLNGAYAAARGAAEVDYKGANVTTAGYEERRREAP